ncbi:MAG: ester cyclase [Acidobacteriaceae bacterium]|nr:ester cyclase [Acidobacteriaceae bacterium]
MKLTLALVLFVCATMSVAFAATTSTAHPFRQEANRAIAMRVFDEILSQGRFEVADQIYAKDFVNHGLHRNFNLQEDQAAARWEKQVAPDMKLTVDLMVADEDFVTAVWTARGTNTARIGWLPATGVKFEEPGITIWRIVDGKIQDEWTSFDELHILRQVVSQLKWHLIAILSVAIILALMAVRLFRRQFSGAH